MAEQIIVAPNKEFIQERWYKKGELKYIVTSKVFKDPTEFFFYEYNNGKFKKISKANNPLKFHEKVNLKQ